MEPGLVFFGLLLVLAGFIKQSVPTLGGDNFVSPREWRRNPERAAEKNERAGELLGYVAIACGAIMVTVGLLAG